MSNKSPNNLLTILWIGSLLSFIHFLFANSSLLPETIAIHFDIYGKPNSWATKNNYLIVMSALCVGINIFLYLLGWKWLPKMHKAYVNVPHKEYWFANDSNKAFLNYINCKILTISAIFMNSIFYICHDLIRTKALNITSGYNFTVVLLGMTILLLLTVGALILPLYRVPLKDPSYSDSKN